MYDVSAKDNKQGQTWCEQREVLVLTNLLMAPTTAQSQEQERVVLKMNKVFRGGCPYTASFLCTAKHFVNRMKYGLKWQKMEAANWNAISTHNNKYQLHDTSAYFVNHMSAFEHATRKKYGYKESERKTLEFSTAAVQHECQGIQHVRSYENSTLALVPFFGGRPPNVTKDLKVKSIGQGNSLIKGEIKAMQTLAVVCSLLRHFATVVVGVTREEDQQYLADTLLGLDNATTARRVKVLPLKTYKPANLPFSLLEWGRGYIRDVNNCVRKTTSSSTTSSSSSSSQRDGGSAPCSALFPSFSAHRIRHVYYTESDQVLHFASPDTRRAVLAATNATTFLIGRRMEKVLDSQLHPASDYMHELRPTRALCGNPKDVFVLDWPASHSIQKVVQSN